LISVIIPAYNEAENLCDLLPWLEQLSEGHEVEILVSTGVCRDDYSICLKGSELTTLISGSKKGRAVQMNEGAKNATGNTLVFLHADVTPPTGFFDDIANTLREKDAGFFSYSFDKSSFLLRVNASFTKRKSLFTGGGDQCLFIKKEVFENLGGFDERHIIMEDFQFFRKMKKNSVPYRIVNNDLIVSARKYQHNSYIRVNLTNLIMLFLFHLGYAPDKLKALHNRLLRKSY